LPISITRRPRPAGLRGQGNHSPKIGNYAKITNRRGPARRCGQPVVKTEIVEAGRRANTPCSQLRQTPHGNTLHTSDAGIVHERGRHHANVAFDKGAHQLLGLAATGLPLSDIHGTTE
jgi:hypothetical protein